MSLTFEKVLHEISDFSHFLDLSGFEKFLLDISDFGEHCECVLCGGREESVCCHIKWLGMEVSVCSDRLGVLGVLRRSLCR